VEEGGVGAGTRTQIETRVLGITKRATHIMREPEPGRVLEEVDVDGFSTTTFVVPRWTLTLASDLMPRPLERPEGGLQIVCLYQNVVCVVGGNREDAQARLGERISNGC